MAPGKAVRYLNSARNLGMIADWNINVGVKGEHVLTYVAVVTLRNRTASGSLGRRRGVTWFSDPELTGDVAVQMAARFVAHNVPEAPL